MRDIQQFASVLSFLLCCGFAAPSHAQLSGTVHIDNEFEIYLSTDDAQQGVLLLSGTNWPTSYSFSDTALISGQDYYLHVRARDTGGVAAFLGEFQIVGTEHTFANDSNTLLTNPADWQVSTSGWGNYSPASAYGANGVSPWFSRPAVDASAQWIWSSDNNLDNAVFFSTKISATRFTTGTFTGGDIGEGLDLEGEFKYAVDLRGSGGVVAGDAAFTDDSAPGISIFAPRDILGWHAAEYGSSPDDDAIESVMSSIRWNTAGTDVVTVTLSDLTIGDSYSLQLLFAENCCSRGFDITVNGDTLQDFAPFDLQGGTRVTSVGAFARYEFTASSTTLDISLGGSAPYPDNNPILNAMTLENTSTISLATPPIFDYRFDDCFFSGLSEDVIDQSANFNASSNGVSIPSNDGVANTSLDLSANGELDWLSVPSAAIDGLDDFTLSIWFKTGVTKPQQQIFHALGINENDNELELFIRGDNIVRVSLLDTSVDLISQITLTDNAFHHLALTRTVSGICLFINGVQQSCNNTLSANALSVPNTNAVVIGQKQDSIGGGFDSAHGFEGLLDEFKLFDIKLSGLQISSIYQSELLGNNYDDSLRAAARCPRTCGVAGNLNAFGIQIGSGGSDLNLGTTTEALDIKAAWLAAGSPSTGLIDGGQYNVINSGSSTVDRIDFGGDVNTFSGTLPYPGFATVGDERLSHFLVYTEGTVNLKAGDYTIYIQSDDGFSFVMETVTGDSVNFNKFGGGQSQGLSNELRFEGPTANTRTGGSFTLSQDSVFDTSFIFFERTGSDYAEVSITDSIIASTTASDYEIMRDGALNGSVSFGCAGFSSINHYQIIHDGQGLTCDTETVTIQACTNAYDGTCTPSGQLISVDVTATGSTSVTESISFVGNGTVSIPYTAAESATLSIANASIIATNPTVCFDGSTTNCNIVFQDAGFRFLNGNTGTNQTIDNQIAGAVFPLRLQAVQNDNGVCMGLFNGPRNLELSQENINPGGTSGLSLNIDGANIAKHPSATETLLNFGSDSIATIPSPIYFDAGQIRLHANYNDSGVSLSGVSNAFWVSPAQLVANAVNVTEASPPLVGTIAIDGASATTSTIYEAGRDFSLSISAVNSAGDITPNYSPGQIQLAVTRTGPTSNGSVDGIFTYAAGANLSSNLATVFQNATLSNFVSGISAFNAAQYSEVGLINFDIQDSNYGGLGIVVPADDINIGRFIPDYFEQSIADNGLLQARCGARTAFHAYSGQMDEATSTAGAIRYLTNPVLTITAYNRQGSITQNYFEDSQGSANDFMKLSASDIAITGPSFDQGATGVDGNLLPLTANISTGILSQNDLTALPSTVPLPRGVLHYQLSSTDNFFYNRSANALVSPFVADIDLAVSAIIDSDNVRANAFVDPSPTGLEVRFGRMLLENSFGPETADIPQIMRLEHYSGSGFILSADNNCTAYEPSRITLTNISLDPALTSLLGSAGNFNAGKTQGLSYQATGAGNQGQIGVEYDSFDWLRYDWDNDGNYDDNPTSVTIFGQYRSDDRLIHWREQF